MTREEAIKRLRGILTEATESENSVCYVTEEDREPLEMAIQALSQEPTYFSPCIDCNKKMDEIRRAYDKLKEHDPCETCGYAEGSPFCLQYCPYDAERKKEQEPTKREIEREYLFQSLCEDFKKLQAENDDLRKRLEQEPCTDTVSREAVDELSKELVHTTRDKADFLCNFWEGLEKLPPVTPRSGKWKVTPMSKIAYCSICDELIKDVPASIVTRFEFCPNCGAKMESEDKE